MEIFDIILLAMIAGFIFLRLRAELGNRTGNEPLPPAAGRGAPGGHTGDGAVDSYGRPVDMRDEVPGSDDTVVDLEEDPALRRAYADIRRADPDFDLARFIEGARSAYPMILEAFWQGDKDTLRTFLSDDVYGQFAGAVEAREERGETLENKILDVSDAQITAARMAGDTAELTVRFTAELVAVTRNSDGDIVDGTLSDAVTVHDKWTFARDTASRDPNWILVATRAG